MNEPAATPDTPAADAAPASAAAPAAPAAPATLAAPAVPGTWWASAAVVGALAVAAITLALIGQQRIKSLEQELVRRQQDSQGQAIEARALAQQAQDLARAAEGKVALLDGRVTRRGYGRRLLAALPPARRTADLEVVREFAAALPGDDGQG